MPLNSLAETLAGGGQFEESLALIDLNIEFHPEDSFTRALQGAILISAGKQDEAIAAFEKALEINPKNSWARQQLERAARKRGIVERPTIRRDRGPSSGSVPKRRFAPDFHRNRLHGTLFGDPGEE